MSVHAENCLLRLSHHQAIFFAAFASVNAAFTVCDIGTLEKITEVTVAKKRDFEGFSPSRGRSAGQSPRRLIEMIAAHLSHSISQSMNYSCVSAARTLKMSSYQEHQR
jgi:hypothetical protein